MSKKKTKKNVFQERNGFDCRTKMLREKFMNGRTRQGQVDIDLTFERQQSKQRKIMKKKNIVDVFC